MSKSTVITTSVIRAFLDFSTFSSDIPSGSFLEKAKIAAAVKNRIPTQTYNQTTLFSSKLAICSSETEAAEPNRARPTIIGPIVVPNELIPPPRFTLLAPVFGSPNKIANGLAAVCCSKKQKPTIKNPKTTPTKPSTPPAKTIAPVPKAKTNIPKPILFCSPIFRQYLYHEEFPK